MILQRLHAKLEAVCPILGVSADGKIDFAENATPTQRDDAYAILDAFDPVAELAAVEAEKIAETGKQVALKTLAEWMRVNGVQKVTELVQKVASLETDLAKAKTDLTTAQTEIASLKAKVGVKQV